MPRGPAERVPAKKKRKRRGVLLSALALILVAALVGGLVVRARSQSSGPPTAIGPSIGAVGPVLDAAASTAPMPTTAGLTAALASAIKQKNLGTRVSVEVADLATGTVLYGHNATVPTTPASTMKLATTIAVLSTRGPNYRITTTAVAGATAGQIVLVAGGDQTLAADATGTYPESGSLVALAAQVRKNLGSITPTSLVVDTSIYTGPLTGPGWIPSDYQSQYLTPIYPLVTDAGRKNPNNHGYAPRYANAETAAAQIFARYLGIPTTAITFGDAPKTPAGATTPTTPGAPLGAVQSAPLIRIIENMLANSDNNLAESMARQVALATGYPASFAGSAAAVIAELKKLGLPTAGTIIVDGSGISHQDRLTPKLLAAIITYAAAPDHPALHAMFTGLPVAGYSGTLEERFLEPGARNTDGMLRAKTGTLTSVSTLAGYVIDAAGRPLIIVVMLEATPVMGAPAAIDKIGMVVRACGCGTPIS